MNSTPVPDPRSAVHHIRLRSGTLTLWVEQAALPLDQLCGFACRRSRKRGFVFVSKVLGKHYPVRPRVMADVHARLAAALPDLDGPAVLIALAETATVLGQGVYEQLLLQTGRSDVLFLHTTRYRLRHPLALDFDESHSHAPEHLLYAPVEPARQALFRDARSLILVDDEISTGRTLANLAAAYRRLNPKLAAVYFVSLTDWLRAEQRDALRERVGLPILFRSLLRGGFTFEDDPTFEPGPMPNVTGRGELKDAWLPAEAGRLGLCGVLRLPVEEYGRQLIARPGERVLVLGSGEFVYPPFRLAQYLEQQGLDVHFQSTTRSPLLVGDDLASVLEFTDNYRDEMPNYLYNVADRCYDRIIIGYETRPLPASHRLPEQLGAQVVFF